MELYELKLISEGVDPDFLNTVNELGLNETVGVGKSGMKANKLIYSADTKKAKELLRSGKKACKTGDYNSAIKDFEESIKLLKKLKDEANNIEDDNAAGNTLYALIWCFLPIIGLVHMQKTISNLEVALKDDDFARKVVYDYKSGEFIKKKEKDVVIDMSDGSTGKVREQTEGISRGNAVGYFDKLIRKVQECIAEAKKAKASKD